MRRLYSIGKPVSLSEADILQRLGGQANTILKLAEQGVDFLPGFLVDVNDLKEDFEGILKLILESGIPEIEQVTGIQLINAQPPLPVMCSLLPDVLLEPNPESHLPEASESVLTGVVKSLIDVYHADPLNRTIPAAIMVRYVPGAENERNTASRVWSYRNTISGKKALPEKHPRPAGLSPESIARLEKAADIIERQYLDIRQIAFIEDGDRIWVTSQTAVTRSTRARLKLLTDLFREKAISNREYIKAISPEELGTLFSMTVDPAAAADLFKSEGGLAGSAGACSGRVFFSASALKKACKQAELENRNRNFILLKESTDAEDLEAISLSRGLITSQGGYTSHAPIVARYLGKPAIIHPGIRYQKNKVSLEGQTIKEGQALTMDVQPGAAPIIYFGTAPIQDASHDSKDLQTLLDQARNMCTTTRVRANAETEKEARLAVQYGADGIGLCRTEHMIMEKSALEKLQRLITGENSDQRQPLLSDLNKYLSGAFLKLFRIMNGLPLTIRLLDAPLHEFLPGKGLHGTLKKQINPMLGGHRGCRLGITRPDLYEMQIRAVLNAALRAHREQIPVQPDVLIPFVMSHREMSILKKGHFTAGHDIKGINTVIRETTEAAGLEKLPFQCRVGAVIEVPAAALSAGKLVHQAEIISFGTNDLTQTTLGISRDDTRSMLQLYEELDIWEGDPFLNLVEPVRQQIEQAVEKARSVRPDLETGICGEAGSNRDTIQFAVQLGLDYISCAAREVPMTLLTAAQIQIANAP